MHRPFDHQPRPITLGLIAALSALFLFVGNTSLAQQEEAPPPQDTEALPPPPAEAPPAPQRIPLSITVSGGVSLGAYEAGFLYYVSEFLKLNPDPSDLKAITGASAGSVNGLLTLMSVCSGEPENPRDSLFWSTWDDVGFEKLFIPEETQPTSAFSKAAFEQIVDRIRMRWDAGLPTDCDVAFGVTATRLEPYAFEVSSNQLSIPRTREKFLMRIEGQGPGKPPRITNLSVPIEGLIQTALPLEDPKADPFELMRSVILASAAFPIAFSPEVVPHCMISPQADGHDNLPPCTLEGARRDLFVDGGVFDNQPLGVAADVVTRGLEEVDGQWQWRPSLDLPRADPPDPTIFFSLDPSVRAWPSQHMVQNTHPTDSVFEMVPHMLGTVIDSARSEELQDLINAHPQLRRRINLGENHMPTASGLLGDFFGFFERDLRRFDFYLGMVDAFTMLRRLAQDQPQTNPAHPAPAWSDDLNQVPEQWHAFYCLRGALESNPKMLTACQADEMRNTRILAQASLDRLYDHCRKLGAQEPHMAIQHAHCRKASAGTPPPRLVALPDDEPDAWQREEDEAPFEHMIRLLSLYKFRFSDLGLKRTQADQAGAMLHQKILDLGEAVAEAHESGGPIIRTVVRRAANGIQYVPVEELLYINVGTRLELGWSSTGPWSGRPNWLRLHGAISLEGLPAIQSSAEDDPSALISMGLEFEPVPWNGGNAELRAGVRAGVLLSPTDKVFFGTCQVEDTGNVASACSRLATQATLSLSLFERLRLQLTGTWLPAIRPGASDFISVTPGLGIQFYGPF